jgi:hypothetical protein
MFAKFQVIEVSTIGKFVKVTVLVFLLSQDDLYVQIETFWEREGNYSLNDI